MLLTVMKESLGNLQRTQAFKAAVQMWKQFSVNINNCTFDMCIHDHLTIIQHDFDA